MAVIDGLLPVWCAKREQLNSAPLADEQWPEAAA
jgi:hypothetical protein